MRKEGSGEVEALLNKCNNMKQIRQLVDSHPSIVEEVLDSLAPVKILLSDIIMRLELKGRPFGNYSAASQEDIESVWNSLHAVDSSLKVSDKHPKASLKSHSAVEEFIKHCCQTRHYSFCIRKCGVSSCSIVDHPVFHWIPFQRYLSFQTPSLKQMATTNHFKRYMVLQQQKNSDLHSQNNLGNQKSYPSVPVSNMYVMLT